MGPPIRTGAEQAPFFTYPYIPPVRHLKGQPAAVIQVHYSAAARDETAGFAILQVGYWGDLRLDIP